MSRHFKFPRRFSLTRRCVVWGLGEIEAWLAQRKHAAQDPSANPAEGPDVRIRRTRPVRRPR
ncbi:helix-turn-helix transcriptional regulator [Caulobacter sp. DWR2-3-1b2]|uniref:helix-turn-helix transcriptional regulator n=1 Tax=unclassified Caulobacter TaxID=2648921 RepID=UPI003CF70839